MFFFLSSIISGIMILILGNKLCVANNIQMGNIFLHLFLSFHWWEWTFSGGRRVVWFYFRCQIHYYCRTKEHRYFEQGFIEWSSCQLLPCESLREIELMADYEMTLLPFATAGTGRMDVIHWMQRRNYPIYSSTRSAAANASATVTIARNGHITMPQRLRCWICFCQRWLLLQRPLEVICKYCRLQWLRDQGL